MEWEDLKLKKERTVQQSTELATFTCVAQPGDTAGALPQQQPEQAGSDLQVREEQCSEPLVPRLTYVIARVTGSSGNV